MSKIQRKLLIASNNAGKLREFKEILESVFEVVLSPSDLNLSIEPEETGATFAENARIKCIAFHNVMPDFWVLSDDSGLCVDVLGGAPGVLSARYAGEHGDSNACMDKLLDALKNEKNRDAYFESSLCLMTDIGQEIYASGRVDGEILLVRDGDGGFGYDPIFHCTELGASFGRATESQKNAVSHRSRALIDLNCQLEKFLRPNTNN